MDDLELEQLLSEEEGSALDFKRDQYPFAAATDDQKSELLKDILAFVNAWRRTSAYILIGVDDARAKRSTPIGVTQHLNDADLQQFVNSKTNRPIEFSYRRFTFRGVDLGIIEIPLQERPVFLLKDFGKLKKGVVYVRRGSSTDEADPSEVARMGATDARVPVGQPTLDLQFADLKSRRLFGSSVKIRSLHLHPRVEAPQLSPPSRLSPFDIPTVSGTNPHFYEEFIDYVAASALLTPIGFALTNDSGVPARAAELSIQIPRQDGLHVVDEDDKPDRPNKHFDLPRFRSSITDFARAASPDPHVSAYSGHHEIVVRFGNVLPKSTVWTTGSVFVGAETSRTITAVARIYAENLINPLEFPLEISIAAEVKPMQLQEIRGLLTQDEL